MRVLFVEDEPALSAAAVPVLTAGGFTVDLVETLADATSAEATFPYDAVLLDRHLPDGDGMTLLRSIRSRHKHMPVILMSAIRLDLDDRLEGLNRGADDYVPKPLAPTELLARLQAILRRAGDIQTETVSVGNLDYDTIYRQASVDGVPVPFARRETDVLECLIRSAGRVVSRSRLCDTIYGFNEDVSVNAIDVSMHRLRTLLKSRHATARVETVRGLGYILHEECSDV